MRTLKSVVLKMLAIVVMTVAAIAMSTDDAFANVTMLNDGSGKELGTILIHSEIKRGDALAFTTAADRIKRVTHATVMGVPFITVELDTPGGDVMEAIQIGRLIHDRFIFTVVKPERVCASACVFILIAGASHTPTNSAHIGLHRPSFDPSYFANLTPQQARIKYNALLETLQNYFTEMGGSKDAFHLMLSTSSDDVRFLSTAELDSFGLRGEDPAWDELRNAKMIEQFGPLRWPLIKQCSSISGDFNGCVAKAYQQYPAN